MVIAILIGVPLTLNALGILDFQDIFIYILSGIVGWSAIIILALIGAIFVGMMLSHRILTVGAFTPFEEEMLKMREDIKSLNKKLDYLMKQNPGDKENKN
jgi:hypothetical protein